MITKEDFKKLVKGCLVLQQNPRHFSYIALETKNACMFCGGIISTKKDTTSDNWLMTCDCKESVKMHNELVTLHQKLIETSQIIDMKHKEIENAALKYFKEYYKNTLIPDIEKAQQEIDQQILSLESLDD